MYSALALRLAHISTELPEHVDVTDDPDRSAVCVDHGYGADLPLQHEIEEPVQSPIGCELSDRESSLSPVRELSSFQGPRSS